MMENETSKTAELSDVARPVQDNRQQPLFDLEPDWHDLWWNMPDFKMENAGPARRIVVNFLTDQDAIDFQNKLDLNINENSDSVWYPEQKRLLPKEYIWRGEPSDCKYPVYIPSKGRAENATTPDLLKQAGVEFYLVVEPSEFADYREKYGDCVLCLPFENLGQGSIPARNWIWEHAKTSGNAWHWLIDDNVLGFWRTHGNRRLVVEQSSAPLRAVEDFADRYENLAFAGLSADGFCPDRQNIAPFVLNTRIYSVTLINTQLPYRWRGKVNEDTDLCLRALKDGWATVLFKAFLMKKAHTSKGIEGGGGMAGGNTDNVYIKNDYRMGFAKSLKEQHPDCVDIVWKFGRFHHNVNYQQFKNNRLILKDGITPFPAKNEYGLKLIKGRAE